MDDWYEYKQMDVKDEGCGVCVCVCVWVCVCVCVCVSWFSESKAS